MEWMQELATALIPLLAAFCGWAAVRLRAGTKKDKTMEYGMKMLLRGKDHRPGRCTTWNGEKSRRLRWKTSKECTLLM